MQEEFEPIVKVFSFVKSSQTPSCSSPGASWVPRGSLGKSSGPFGQCWRVNEVNVVRRLQVASKASIEVSLVAGTLSHVLDSSLYVQARGSGNLCTGSPGLWPVPLSA